MHDRRPLAGLCASLLLGIACGDAPPASAPQSRVGVEAAPEALPEPAGISPPLPSAPSPAPERAPTPPPSPPEALAAPAPPLPPAEPLAAMRPLEELLRLPPAGEPDSRPLVLPPEPEAAAKAPAAKAERRMHVELGSRTDASLIDPKKARTRTDAGVAVDVGKDTTLHTGVRVEQQTGLEREDPTPTLGIERRF